jgi:hypothetical protein
MPCPDKGIFHIYTYHSFSSQLLPYPVLTLHEFPRHAILLLPEHNMALAHRKKKVPKRKEHEILPSRNLPEGL